MINPPSPFGQPEQAAPAPEPEAEPSRRPRTLAIAAVAGAAALAVLGGATALVLTGGDDTADLATPAVSAAPVEPSVAPTASVVAPLPTAAVRGRNVFLPLVADEGADGAEVGAVDPGASSGSEESSDSGSDTDSESTAVPTASGGFVALPVTPRPAQATSTVTETVEVPGPVQTVPGPTATVTTPPETVEVQVPGATFEALEVEVDGLPGGFTATFTVDYGDDDVEVYEDLDPAETFGQDDEFTFVAYDGTVLTFQYVSSLFNISVAPLT